MQPEECRDVRVVQCRQDRGLLDQGLQYVGVLRRVDDFLDSYLRSHPRRAVDRPATPLPQLLVQVQVAPVHIPVLRQRCLDPVELPGCGALLLLLLLRLRAGGIRRRHGHSHGRRRRPADWRGRRRRRSALCACALLLPAPHSSRHTHTPGAQAGTGRQQAAAGRHQPASIQHIFF